MLNLTIELTPEAIQIPAPPPTEREVGASVSFSGTVRATENGQPISALRYEVYETMAVREIERLLRELAETYPSQTAHVIHRHGWIPVGETAIWIRVESQHRQAAFGLVTAFMDRLKLDVPIWKVESRRE